MLTSKKRRLTWGHGSSSGIQTFKEIICNYWVRKSEHYIKNKLHIFEEKTILQSGMLLLFIYMNRDNVGSRD